MPVICFVTKNGRWFSGIVKNLIEKVDQSQRERHNGVLKVRKVESERFKKKVEICFTNSVASSSTAAETRREIFFVTKIKLTDSRKMRKVLFTSALEIKNLNSLII